MKVAVLLAGAALSLGVLRSPASAADTLVVPTAVATSALPVQLGPNARALYRAVFDDIDAGRWTEAASKLDVMPDGPLHAVARAAIYLGKGSPKVDGAQLAALATNAPQLPEASTLVRLAAARGIDALPALPEPRTLGWLGTSPHRMGFAPILTAKNLRCAIKCAIHYIVCPGSKNINLIIYFMVHYWNNRLKDG